MAAAFGGSAGRGTGVGARRGRLLGGTRRLHRGHGRCRRRCGRQPGAGAGAATGTVVGAAAGVGTDGAACGVGAAAAPDPAAGTAVDGAAATSSGAGFGSGRNCAARSKISPGPGWILVVGERGAACVNTFDSSNSVIRRPALPDSPRISSSRWVSLPRVWVFTSICVSHVSSGSSLVISSSTCTEDGKANLRSRGKL